MRRAIIRPAFGGLDGIGADSRGDRDATECRRAIVAAARFEISGGISVLPSAIHAFGIVSYK